MRFLITMNMPSAKNFLVHQITIEHEAASCKELCKLMNTQEFILGRLLYRRNGPMGDLSFEDRGDLILNTAHIGKVQEFYEMERNFGYDEPYGHSQPGYQHFEGEGPAIRKRRFSV